MLLIVFVILIIVSEISIILLSIYNVKNKVMNSQITRVTRRFCFLSFGNFIFLEVYELVIGNVQIL